LRLAGGVATRRHTRKTGERAYPCGEPGLLHRPRCITRALSEWRLRNRDRRPCQWLGGFLANIFHGLVYCSGSLSTTASTCADDHTSSAIVRHLLSQVRSCSVHPPWHRVNRTDVRHWAAQCGAMKIPDQSQPWPLRRIPARVSS
jgi:hypothetical protein